MDTIRIAHRLDHGLDLMCELEIADNEAYRHLHELWVELRHEINEQRYAASYEAD